jgi:Protein of unknown function (DUF2762).
MEAQAFIDFAASQGIWCALFIWLFISSRKDSKERENQLMKHLEEQGGHMKDIANAIDKILSKLHLK